jgi:hypothetical protein
VYLCEATLTITDGLLGVVEYLDVAYWRLIKKLHDTPRRTFEAPFVHRLFKGNNARGEHFIVFTGTSPPSLACIWGNTRIQFGVAI